MAAFGGGATVESGSTRHSLIPTKITTIEADDNVWRALTSHLSNRLVDCATPTRDVEVGAKSAVRPPSKGAGRSQRTDAQRNARPRAGLMRNADETRKSKAATLNHAVPQADPDSLQNEYLRSEAKATRAA